MSTCTLTPQRFREILAGVVAPEVPEDAPDDYRQQAAQLVELAARLYNHDELDSLKMWTRIETGIRAAVAKAPNGEGDMLVSEVLEHVKASASAVACSPEVKGLIETINRRERSWRSGFVAYLGTALYSAMVFGRERYLTYKEARKAERTAEAKSDA